MTSSDLAHTETAEYFMLLILLIYSVVIFVQSYSLSPGGAIFPQSTSIILIVGILSLLLLSVFPNPYRENLFKVFDEDTKINKKDQSDKILLPYQEVLLLTLLFILIGYVIGLLWAAPIFSFIYLRRANKDIKMQIIITALVTGLALTFLLVLDAPIESGIIDPMEVILI